MLYLKAYRADGTTRAISARPFARVARRHRVMPARGSNVIAITEGERAGYFHVDFSPLANLMCEEKYRVCLTEVFESHEEAVRAEHRWLVANWVLEIPG